MYGLYHEWMTPIEDEKWFQDNKESEREREIKLNLDEKLKVRYTTIDDIGHRNDDQS